MYNRIIKTGALLAAVCFFLAALSVSDILAEGGARVVVQKIEKKELDKLMESRENSSLVVAMASWCGPCREELPFLIRLYNKYENKGLKIVGISLDVDGPEAMQKIADTIKINFPIYWTKIDMSEKYNIYAIPTIYLIKNGKIVEKLVGKQSENSLEERIGRLLK